MTYMIMIMMHQHTEAKIISAKKRGTLTEPRYMDVLRNPRVLQNPSPVVLYHM